MFSNSDKKSRRSGPGGGEGCPSVNPIGYLETGIIFCDDNRSRLAEFPADCVDLIYLDPPFFSNRHYEVIWGDEAEVRSFEDRWEGGINVYINWMRERVTEMHRVLRPTGSLFLHCDWHASHHLRVMLDDVFGERNFQNELIWYYRGGGSSPRRWSRKHDSIYWYTKGKSWTFNLDEVRTPYSDEILSRPKSSYRHHHYGSKSAAHAVTEGWDLNPKGKRPDDVIEMPIINPGARERLGYPTQKPEALLDIIIRAASGSGDIVLDPFAGCGTTLVVAENLGRQWIGIDISPTAVSLMQRRMTKVGATAKVIGLPVTVDDLRALRPFEFQNWVIQRVHGTHSPRKTGDMGIDGFSFLDHQPIQVKQSERVGRNVVDNFETAIRRDGKQKGYIVALSFTRGAREEAARARSEEKLDIHLVEVADLLVDDGKLIAPRTDLLPLFAEEMARDLLPTGRAPNARPTAEELVVSDRDAGVERV